MNQFALGGAGKVLRQGGLALALGLLVCTASATQLATGIVAKASSQASQLAPRETKVMPPAPEALAAGNPLVGSWQLVSGRYLDGAGNWVDYQSLGLEAIKVLSARHFSFTTTKQADNQPAFWAAGSGEYQLEGSSYTEFPTLNSFDVPAGKGFRFEFELSGDEWRTRRIEDGTLKEEELWRRLD